MDKNTITGFVLIAAILFGFTFYQSRQARKAAEWQAQQDSIALAERIAAGDTVEYAISAEPSEAPVATALEPLQRPQKMTPSPQE